MTEHANNNEKDQHEQPCRKTKSKLGNIKIGKISQTNFEVMIFI